MIFLFLFIKSIKNYFKAEIINPYNEKHFQLTNSEFAKIYSFYPRISDYHEIIVQINSNYNGNAHLCTGYFKNKEEENIYYNYRNNEYLNCQNNYTIQSISYIEEFNITYNYFNSTNKPTINGYYLIILYLDKSNIKEFSGTITSFIPDINVEIQSNNLPQYFYYKNNYNLKNYSYTIYPNYKQNKNNVHLQILSYSKNNIFNINITNNENNTIDQKSNIFSYNIFLYNNSNEENIFYLVNLSFMENNSEINNYEFAIYIEYSSFNNNLIQLKENINEINYLVKNDYYFYLNLSEPYINDNDEFFFLVNDLSFKMTTFLYSLEVNIDLKDLNNITYLQNYIYSSNFNYCKSRFFRDSIFLYKCVKSQNINDNKNMIIIKVSGSGLFPLKIRTIMFKELKKININDNEYIDRLYYKSFNSEYLLDKIGYFYISKINNTKRQLMYCSKDNTMIAYYGDYDIFDNNQKILNYDNLRLFKISHNNSDYLNNNFDGFTIFTYNKDNNYFIQLIDINIDTYDNLLIEKTDIEHLNKEIIFDNHIKNYYIFYINEFNIDIQDIIIDAQILYGRVDIKYIDIDLIEEKKFNLNKILDFNHEDYSIIGLNHPILVKQTTEFIKINNNNFNLEYYYKAKLYLNKYMISKNKNWKVFTPTFLNPYESKIYSLDNIYGNKTILLKLGDNYEDYTNNINDNLVSIILGNNKINNIFHLSNQNNIILGKEIYLFFGDTITFINNCNKSILIWSDLGIFPNENIISLYLSQNFYYLYTFNNVHRLCFDWFNIKKKLEYGLIPQKILISLLNEQQTKSNGFYYQVINKEDDNNDYFYYHSFINSIRYELDQGDSHNFLNEDINISEYDYYFTNNFYINYIIYPSSGLSTIIFYVEYLYDISNYLNILKFLEFDNSVYSLDLKIDNSYIEKKDSYDNYNYLVFQCLSCNSTNSIVNFKYNNNSYSINDNNEENINMKSISPGNVLGYINIKIFNTIINTNELYIHIIKPYISYIKYYYTKNINNNYIFQNNYNINIEKGLDNKKTQIIVSFDCFLKNTKTNYTFLILNKKSEIKKEINNECEFFFILEKRNNSKIDMNHLNFIDNNENIRIKKEISFNEFGNYRIYILAQSLGELSIIKYLGSESYTYTDNYNHNSNNEKFEAKNQEIITILIFIILLIILIILFFVFHYIRKKKITDLFNTLNISPILNDFDFSQNQLIEFNDLNNEIKINNKNSINDDSDNDNDNNFLLFEKPIEENKNNESKNNNINLDNDKDKDKDNKDLELDPGLLGQSPAPLLGSTFASEEDRIKNELAKINKSSNISNNNDIEKKYINTNNGLGDI